MIAVSKTPAEWEQEFEREFLALGDTSLAERRPHLISLIQRAINGERERCVTKVANWFGETPTSPGYDCIRDIRGGNS
jgi:hypothetical protein